eukprot:COSAG05_NODE_1182_length_5594_cov_31.189081_2_plen_113_part_00
MFVSGRLYGHAPVALLRAIEGIVAIHVANSTAGLFEAIQRGDASAIKPVLEHGLLVLNSASQASDRSRRRVIDDLYARVEGLLMDTQAKDFGRQLSSCAASEIRRVAEAQHG